ncbi:MAG: archaemetzincin family Zn-dependent metalloprotease [Prolixibacteraceae bacterium]|nr:archaemetzincin family Zn-dependent metalloprotease [Prolixibacteraceae bacterium]
MLQPHILLVSFGGFEKKLLQRLAEALRIETKAEVQVRDIYFDLNLFYDPTRRQYNGNELMKEVDALFPGNQKVIALFNVDLFIPILTYIFGQAMLNGRIGIVSAYRLGNERYGLEPDPALYFDRLVKEIMHELGHMLGLIHCHSPLCVMRSSTYVEDIDQKHSAYCKNCLEMLSENTGHKT